MRTDRQGLHRGEFRKVCG